MNIVQVGFGIFAISAAFTDVMFKRIPNSLCVIGFVYGLLTNIALNGWNGGASAVIGGVVGFTLSLMLHVFGAIGAGDVKWFAAAGAITSFHSIMILAILSVIVSGCLGAIAYVVSRRFRDWLKFCVTETFYGGTAPFFSRFAAIRGISEFRFPYMCSVLAAMALIELGAAGWL